MNLLLRILIGGLVGWLTGKAVEIEGRSKVEKEGHIRDVLCGIAGAVAGESLFFWMVIGKGDGLSSFATTVLGAVAVVGAVRLIVERSRAAQA
jgi:uncharacterized membrane protein YeaQ/YmgE (transglycosylase-associated protein family)